MPPPLAGARRPKRTRKRRGPAAPGVIPDGAFLERAAHLLKNHATAVQAASHLLLQGGAGADEAMRDRWRNALRESAAGLHRLLGQMEQLGHELSPAPPPVSPVPLASWLREQVRSARAATPRARVTLTAGSAPAGTWRFATASAALALGCLLRNALAHPPAGARAKVTGREVPGGFLLVVADNGRGVPATEAPRLFTPFFRGEAALERPGAGLGLVIARAAVTRAGGRISHHSVSPRGARFELFIRGTRLPPS
ncbi:MAG: sensor histidine kinase [Opitutaceae bacterium]